MCGKCCGIEFGRVHISGLLPDDLEALVSLPLDQVDGVTASDVNLERTCLNVFVKRDVVGVHNLRGEGELFDHLQVAIEESDCGRGAVTASDNDQVTCHLHAHVLVVQDTRHLGLCAHLQSAVDFIVDEAVPVEGGVGHSEELVGARLFVNGEVVRDQVGVHIVV